MYLKNIIWPTYYCYYYYTIKNFKNPNEKSKRMIQFNGGDRARWIALYLYLLPTLYRYTRILYHERAVSGNKVTTVMDGDRIRIDYTHAFRCGIKPPPSSATSVKSAPPDIFFPLAPFAPREPRNALWQTFRNICNGLAVIEPKRPATAACRVYLYTYRRPRLPTAICMV